MEAKNKKTYEAPEAIVVNTQPEGIICNSGNYVMWFLAEPDMSTTEVWSRGDYGGANEI
ncbi:MAG: hypothetical protein IK030_04375 [Bacteroidales bacterium]|nr:hypothetical protein [Bacteroidales bacterium]